MHNQIRQTSLLCSRLHSNPDSLKSLQVMGSAAYYAHISNIGPPRYVSPSRSTPRGTRTQAGRTGDGAEALEAELTTKSTITDR